MIEDCIMDGDFIVVRSQKIAKAGDTVVALVEGAATVKKYFKKNNRIELHPANSALRPIIVTGGDFKIQGIVVGLIRKYL
jgi:repressor LexA